jgi:BirA family biotin operon repressor/biotin-[acetyl-CoA-carboxylase] ligase
MSLVYRSYSEHREPWLIGMAVAIAVARATRARLQWPNDVVFDRRKLAGVLTELLPAGPDKKVPVIGVGVNLNQASFPDEIAGSATSMFATTGVRHDARTLAHQIVGEIAGIPEPDDWRAIAADWAALDDSPGKSYRLATGETAVARRIGEQGALVCTVGGVERKVMAADSILGR